MALADDINFMSCGLERQKKKKKGGERITKRRKLAVFQTKKSPRSWGTISYREL